MTSYIFLYNKFAMDTMSQIQIKHIAEDDFENFHLCLDAVSRERKFLGFIKAPALEKTRKWLLAGMEQGEIRLIALDGSQTVGWCDIETNEREGFSHSGKLGMGILKEYRRQGLGTKLLEKALSVAKAEHLERVELDVYASNTTAIKLYEKFNFQIEGRKHNARKLDGIYDDIIVMAILFDQ